MRYQNPQLIDRLAAEYVLGTLVGRARRRFETLMITHPEVRPAVAAWEQRLGQVMTSEAPTPEVKPPEVVWQGLEAQLFDRPKAFARRPSWWEQVALWRLTTVAFGTLAAFVTAVWIATPQLHQPGPGPTPMMAAIGDNPDQTTWVVSTVGDMERLMVKNVKPMDLAPSQGCVLWLRMPETGQDYPLGQLPDRGGSALLEVKPDLRPMVTKGELFVTMESMADESADPMPAQPGGPPRFRGQWISL